MNNSRHLFLIATLLLAGMTTRSSAYIVGFEDLPSSSGTTGATDLEQANNGSLSYGGILWDSRVAVVGKDHVVADGSPLFSGGAPGGGNFYLTNTTSAPSYGNGIVLTTNDVLKGAYFGSVEYYGYSVGEGASKVSIVAMHDSTPLQTLEFDLVPNTQTGGGTNTSVPMTYFDTSDFGTLTGITGYVINRTNPHTDPSEATNANWVADNFDFTPASSPIPEPANGRLALGCLISTLACVGFRKMRRSN